MRPRKLNVRPLRHSIQRWEISQVLCDDDRAWLFDRPVAQPYTANLRVSNHFDLVVSTYSYATYEIETLSIALAHVGVLILLSKLGLMRFLTRSLRAVGPMALTNYLTYSIVCSTIFCGYGFAMYGTMERYQLDYVVAGLSMFQLVASPIWLRHFQYGPAEWTWRALTYWQKQPMRRRLPVLIEPAQVA